MLLVISNFMTSVGSQNPNFRYDCRSQTADIIRHLSHVTQFVYRVIDLAWGRSMSIGFHPKTAGRYYDIWISGSRWAASTKRPRGWRINWRHWEIPSSRRRFFDRRDGSGRLHE